MVTGPDEAAVKTNTKARFMSSSKTLFALSSHGALDPDGAITMLTPPAIAELRELSVCLGQLNGIHWRCMEAAGRQNPNLQAFLAECKFLSTEIEKLSQLLARLPNIVVQLKGNSVHLKKELSMLEDLASRLCGMSVILEEYWSDSDNDSLACDLIDRHLIFLQSEMADFAYACMRFRGQIGFAASRSEVLAEMEADI
jgi:hypothetical protein